MFPLLTKFLVQGVLGTAIRLMWIGACSILPRDKK